MQKTQSKLRRGLRLGTKTCGLRLGTNFGARLVADKNFYLRLTVAKIHAFVVSTDNVYGRAAQLVPILRL